MELLEVERAQARYLFRVKAPADGAAPLIASSGAIKTLRERPVLLLFQRLLVVTSLKCSSIQPIHRRWTSRVRTGSFAL
jgi:hypothetical protein